MPNGAMACVHASIAPFCASIASTTVGSLTTPSMLLAVFPFLKLSEHPIQRSDPENDNHIAGDVARPQMKTRMDQQREIELIPANRDRLEHALHALHPQPRHREADLNLEQ